MDTPAAIAAFMSGEGGIYPTGTWMIGSFEQEAKTPGRPLHNSYAVFLIRGCGASMSNMSAAMSGWCRSASGRPRSARRSRASSALADHNFDWARTGHLPAFKAVLDEPRFKALPHRRDIAPLATIGRPLPGYVQRQNAIEGIVGEETVAAFTGQKPIGDALGEAERRVNSFSLK